ncbi:PAS domain-containing sensor histidine kinase [Natrinema salsiterrestre]|uniref:histidine kinase n=1 Tax=Natrinema salsiterrestre TaxID=2950540 RepID=A0A9Q4Q4B3_9EURY|nr:PAS domain S-box protein [Natrinema salsiterrestre]MDF9747048.1 PAS domain S-box protein [Natrinema salsiterrestre]
MSTRAGATDEAFWEDADADVALRRYRTLVETLDDGIYQLDADGNFVAVNDELVEIVGYSRDELLGEHVTSVVHEDDVPPIEREIATDIETGDGIDPFHLVLRTADGNSVPCELRISTLVEGDEFQGTLGIVRDRSERTRQLRTLESARASYESITDVLDAANIGVFVLDDEYRIEWIDETIEEYFDLDRASVIGRDKRDVLEHDIRETVADSASFSETVLATYDHNSDTERFECRVLTGEDDDRDERWLEHYSKPIESGAYAGGRVEFYSDITDKKRSEGALRERTEAFRSLVDAVEEYAIFRLDTDGHVISWNEGAKQIKGYDRDEILGEHFSTFYTAADRSAGVPERNLEAALENGSAEDEGWRRRKDGTQFWANVTITPIRDDDGTHRGFLKVTRDMTDRWERKRELETELERILGRISDAFYAVDDEFRFTHVNDRAAELLQHTEAELLGKSLWEVFPDLVEFDEVWDAFHTALETQEPTSYELYYDTLDFWVEANLYPSETGISVYFRDVTERRERERELERTERRFEAIFEDPNILVGLLDTDGTVLDVNGTAMEYVDAEHQAVIGEPFWETPWWEETADEESDAVRDGEAATTSRSAGQPSGDDAAGIRSAVREWVDRAADGEYVDFEADLTRPDGRQYTLEGVFRPVTNDDGEVVSIVVSDRDITERKQREQALQESRNQLRTLIDLLPVAVFVAEADGRIVKWNEAAEEIWGGEIAESQSVAEYERYDGWWADTGERVEPEEWALARALRGEEVTDPDVIEIEGFDGERRTVLNHGMPVRDANGEVSRAVVTLTDITERTEYQRKLEESNERLEQFAYAASHDLQEPLRMVTSYLQLLEKRYGDAFDEDGEEFLAYAVDGAERMREMIDGLLEYSRVETRGDPFEPTDLNAILEDVLENLQIQIEESDAEITSEDLPDVSGDANQLRQVLQNLLSNALTYSGDDPPRVHVGAERRGDEWVISVRDEGIGIDPGDHDRVFTVFDRLHSREEYDGTGIGLALCQRIVERHGGEIWVDSEPGDGSTFSFTLPAAETR